MMGTRLVVTFAAILLAAAVASSETVEGSRATLSWSAASGPVAGYVVMVSRDGDAYEVEETVTTASATIDGSDGERVRIKVAAFDAQGALGPVSPASGEIRFVAPAVPVADDVMEFTFPGDYGVVGDWNGDGVDTVGVYDSASGTWYLSEVSGNPTSWIEFSFGPPGLLPVAGDWNGNGVDTVGLYDRSASTWYLAKKNRSDSGTTRVDTPWNGGHPMAGDWDGDGDDNIGIHQPGAGRSFLVHRNVTGAGWTQVDSDVTQARPVAGDWDGDGHDTVGLYVGATGTWNLNEADGSWLEFQFQPKGGQGVVGDWDDDGVDGIGVFLPGSGEWTLAN